MKRGRTFRLGDLWDLVRSAEVTISPEGKIGLELDSPIGGGERVQVAIDPATRRAAVRHKPRGLPRDTGGNSGAR